MKIIKCIAIAFVSLVAVSCNNSEDPIESLTVKQPMSFTASIEGGPSARQDTSGRRYTHLLDNWRVWFDAGDAISVFDGNNDNRSFVTNVGGATAFFEGEAASAGTYTALYPYQADATLDGTNLEAVLPSAQRPVPGSYDPEANLSVATTDNSEKNFFFYNVCALLKFSVYAEAAGVEVRALGGDKLAGRLTIDVSSGIPSVVSATDDRVGIRDEDYVLMPGVDYYIAVAPGKYSAGFKVEVDSYTEGLFRISFEDSNGFILERGKFYDLGLLKRIDL